MDRRGSRTDGGDGGAAATPAQNPDHPGNPPEKEVKGCLIGRPLQVACALAGT